VALSQALRALPGVFNPGNRSITPYPLKGRSPSGKPGWKTIVGDFRNDRSKAGRLTYVGQPSRLAPGVFIWGQVTYQAIKLDSEKIQVLDMDLSPNPGEVAERSKAGRLTYVGQPSRLAPGVFIWGQVTYQAIKLDSEKIQVLDIGPVPKSRGSCWKK
jgi:hypothetical protein